MAREYKCYNIYLSNYWSFSEFCAVLTIVMPVTRTFRNKFIVYVVFLSTLIYAKGLTEANRGGIESDGNF